MSLASVEALKPNTKKITLVELDIGQQQTVWFNWAAGVWYVDFDAIYDLIDADFLAGVSAQTIDNVGSVSSDAAPLLIVADAATVQEVELSFYFDDDARRVYIHLQNGDEPSLHRVVLGIVYGVANHAGIYNGMIYEGRLKSAPSISKSKDPLFFGRISFDGGTIEIDNEDGFFDTIGEDNDVFGNAARILQGFEGFAYSDFVRIGAGIIGNIDSGPERLMVSIKDARWNLTRDIPMAAFDQTTFPDLKDGNVGKSIPVTWGVLRNIPVICTNEDAAAPANYTFKFSDTTYHSVHALTQVRVKGVAKATSASDLDAGTFSLASANYSPGDEVTADIEGYEDDDGNLISNALDVILDILYCYFGMDNIPAIFNQAEWAAATTSAPDVCYFGDDPEEAIDIIEEICASARVAFIARDDGRFTARIYNPNAAVKQTFEASDLLEVPTLARDQTEVLTSARVGYSKDWAKDEWIWLNDTDDEAETYARFKTHRSRDFETLLTTEAAAQTFADDILSLSGDVSRRFPARMKLQPLEREIVDFIKVNIGRRNGPSRWVKAEIAGIAKDLIASEISLDCRVVEFYPETIYVQGGYWGEGYWGDELWCMTYEEAVS
jgi:hypothetical protein